jgi:membrane-associated phospholipid phosphatase
VLFLRMFLLEVNSFFSAIDAIDRQLFFAVNRGFSNHVFDTVLPYLREATFWVPLYLFILVFMPLNFGKKGWLWVLAILSTAALTDIVSSHILKPLIQRPRPCWNEEIGDQVRLLASYCGRNFSFTSSHATNHFGVAAFIVFTLKNYLGKGLHFFWLWAAAICLAQVYVGVHYPIDVVGGALLGTAIGRFMATLFNKKIGLIKQ